VDATEADLAQFATGRPFTFSSRAFPGETFTEKSKRCPRFSNPATHTIKVRGSVDNSRRLLKAEMFVNVSITDHDAPSATVPSKAVFLSGEKHYVFLERQPGDFARREVRIGPEHDGHIPILAGVEPGQRVVDRGLPPAATTPQVIRAMNPPCRQLCPAPAIVRRSDAILFIGGGVAAFHQLPIEAFPDVSDTQVNVIALYPGRAPEEVEKQVTIALETVLTGLPHMVRMFSHTQFGLSFIMLTFDDRTTDAQARQQTSNDWRRPISRRRFNLNWAPLSTAIGEIFRYVIRSDQLNSRDLRTIEDWVVERNLRPVRAWRTSCRSEDW